MLRVIFNFLLLAITLLPLKAVGLYYLWNEVIAKAIMWAGPISWTQSFVAILCFIALSFTLSFNRSE